MPSLLLAAESCQHPLDARRLGGRAGVTIVCMLCGSRAESGPMESTGFRGRIH